jgi:hypothetical protein
MSADRVIPRNMELVFIASWNWYLLLHGIGIYCFMELVFIASWNWYLLLHRIGIYCFMELVFIASWNWYLLLHGIGIYCIFDKQATLSRRSKDGWTRNQDNVAEWRDITTSGL